jgi:predicted permease
MLRRRPTYTAIVLATLMLGIGMNTAIFSVLYGVLLQPLPFDDPGRLVRIGRAAPTSTWLNPISPAEFRDLEQRLESLEIVAAASGGRIMSDEQGAELVLGSIVTRGLFDLLGVAPQRGRFFTAADVAADAAPVIVLSDTFWRNRLGGDPEAIDSIVELGDTEFRVIGIAPPGFRFRPNYDLSGAEYWEPVQWTANNLQARHSHYLMVYGRIAADASLNAASDEISAVWRSVVAEDPGNHLDSNYELGMQAVPLRQFNVLSSRDALVFLAGAVGLILLIACANVANLLLSNAESRQHELAVRAAIGAGRGRLTRQFLTESLLLAVVGGALGIATAYSGVRATLSAFPDAVPRSAEIGLHIPVLAFATGISILLALVLGAVISMQADLESVEARAGRTRTRRRSLFRKGLVVAEVTLALVLVIAAGLMLKSYWKLSRVDLGFVADDLVAVNVTLPPARYRDPEARAVYYETLVESLAARPEVDAVGMTSLVPVRSYGSNVSGLTAVGESDRRASYVEVRYVTPGYHETLGVPLVRGRGFTRADVESEARVVLINQTLARQLFDDQDAIGRQLDFDDPVEIVGIVGDMRAFGPDRDVAPYVYFPTRYASNVVIRLRTDAEAFVPQLRSVVRDVDAEARAWRIETMDTIVADAIGDRRFHLLLIGTFALVAMALGAIGTYGVMVYSIETQMREFGVRVAIGATAADIRGLVLRSAGTLAALGLALGVVGAYVLRRFVANLLVEVQPWDPMVYAGTALTMAIVALLACWIPTRRAVRADPVEILRRE